MSVTPCDMLLIEEESGEEVPLTMDQARAAVRIYDAGEGRVHVGDVVCEWRIPGCWFLINDVAPSADDIADMRKILTSSTERGPGS